MRSVPPPPAAPSPAAAPPIAPVPVRAEGDVVGQAWLAMMTGEHDKVIALAPFYESGEVPELAEPLAWSLATSAKELAERAEGAGDEERQGLESKAHEYARRADAIRPGLGATALGPRLG